MKIGRRGMLAAAPVAAAAAPVMAANIAKGQQINPFLHNSAYIGGGAEVGRAIGGPSIDPNYALWEKGYKAFREAMKPHQAADEARNHFRSIAGFDADLYALKSIPMQAKVMIQFRRDRERAQERMTLEERIKTSVAKQFGIESFNP